MKETDVDELMRKVLIDSLVLDWDDTLKTAPALETSNKFSHQMKVRLVSSTVRAAVIKWVIENGMKHILNIGIQERLYKQN